MKKLFIAGACVIVAVIVVIVVVGALNLGSLIKTAVNTYGPAVVKTGVEVEAVDVSVFSAQAELNNFVLDNPEGFTTPRAIQVKSISMDVDESSFVKDTIVIDRIEVDHPEITYEIKGRTDNFRTIMDQMKKSSAPEAKPEKKSATVKEGRKLLIRSFIIKGGRVNMAASILKGKVATVSLPDIYLQNIGQGTGGSPEEVSLQVLQAVYGKITSPDLTGEFARQLKALGIAYEDLNPREQIREVKDKLEDVKTDIKGVGEQFKGLFHK